MYYVWFGEVNRTSAYINCQLILLCSTWVIVYTSLFFLILTSGGRRLSTFIITTLSVTSGFTLTMGICDRQWIYGQLQTETSYTRFMPNAIPGILTVNLGLTHLNISYDSLDSTMEFFYNEQFKIDGDEWHSEDVLQQEYIKALWRGTPNPVLIILEFLSCDWFGFIYRKAGFVTLVSLWMSLILWMFCQALLLYAPKAASRPLFFTGLFTLLSAFNYFNSVPTVSFHLYVEGTKLNLHIGRTFYIVIFGGCINVILGLVFGIGGRCKTSFEVYYGTSFDFYEITAKYKSTKSRTCSQRNEKGCELSYVKFVNQGFVEDSKICDGKNDLKVNLESVLLSNENILTNGKVKMKDSYKHTIVIGHYDESSILEDSWKQSIECDSDNIRNIGVEHDIGVKHNQTNLIGDTDHIQTIVIL